MTSFPPAPAGQFDGAVHLFTVRAYFEDTDLSGVVYHANYLRWFERARSDMVRLLGMDQRAANEGGDCNVFDQDDNALVLLWRDGGRLELGAGSKALLARRLMAFIVGRYQAQR